ncbi:STAS domain-containing protein [Chloroflexota bacterium]
MTILHNTLKADVHLVKLNGPLNSSQTEEVKQIFTDAYKTGAKHLIVNLEDVPFMDSSGLVALVAGLKIFDSNAKIFRLVAPQTQPKLLFELTGFDNIFQIFDSVTEAVVSPSVV